MTAKATACAILWLFAGQAIAGALNPTSADLVLSLPIELNGRRLGDINTTIDTNDRPSVLVGEFAALFEGAVDEPTLERITGASVNGQLDSDSLGDADGTLSLNSLTLTLEVVFPPRALRTQRIDLAPRSAVPYELLAPARLSAFANLTARHQFADSDSEGSSTSTTLGARGLVKLGRPFLDYDIGLQVNGDDRDGLVRRATALNVDFENANLRFSIGDVANTVVGQQRSYVLGGVQLTRDYTFRGLRSSRRSAEREFELAEASEVELFVGEDRRGIYTLAAGRYVLDNIPLVNGRNDVVLQITDTLGRIERLSFVELFSASLLPEGESTFSVAAGLPSAFTENGLEYADSRPLISGNYRVGIAGGRTLGTYVTTRSSAFRFGFEAVQALSFGNLSAEAGFARDPAEGASGHFAGLGVFGDGVFGRTYLGRFSLTLRTENDVFNRVASGFSATVAVPGVAADTGTGAGQGGAIRSSRASLAWSLPSGARRSVSYSLQANTESAGGERTLALSGGLGGRFAVLGGLGWNVRARHTRDEIGEQNYDIGLSLSWQRRGTRVSVGHSLRGEASTLGLATSRGTSLPGDWRSQLDIDRVPDEDLGFSAIGAVVFDRAEADLEFRSSSGERQGESASLPLTGDITTGVDGDEPSNLPDGFEGDVALGGGTSGSIVLRTALGLADSSLAFGRPVGDSFVVLRRHPSLDGRRLLVNDGPTGYQASTKLLDSILVSGPSAYAVSSMDYGVDDLPLGYDIGLGRISMRAEPGSGYRLTVGSNPRLTVLGTLVEKGTENPLPLLVGQLRHVETTDLSPFFTDRSGRFSAQGLRDGAYEILIDQRVSGVLTLPAGPELVRRLGRVEIDEQVKAAQ